MMGQVLSKPPRGAHAGALALALGLALGAVLALAACSPSETLIRQSAALHTTVTLTINAPQAPEVYQRLLARFAELDKALQADSPQGELWAVNAAAGREPVTVGKDTLAVARLALELSALTKGAFDPTIGPITALWDISGDKPRVPEAAEIELLLPLVGYQGLRIDAEASQLFLERAGMRLDFGGIAKGYAAQQAAQLCREAGVGSALLNLGDSSIVAIGSKAPGKPWRIGIQNPLAWKDQGIERGARIGVVELSDALVVSSGTYQRFFEQDGRRYHHIMDPRLGRPVENGLEQVTLILPPDFRFADGISSSVLIMGREAGMALIESLPGAAGILVDREGTIWLSSRAETYFKLEDPGFKVVKTARGA